MCRGVGPGIALVTARVCLVLWSKAAEALSTTPSKGVAFAGLVLWSKAAEALSTTPSKGATFAGYSQAVLQSRKSSRH
jgi:hypothetical protein